MEAPLSVVLVCLSVYLRVARAEEVYVTCESSVICACLKVIFTAECGSSLLKAVVMPWTVLPLPVVGCLSFKAWLHGGCFYSLCQNHFMLQS